MSVVTAILTSANCNTGRAGISVLYAAKCTQIDEITFDDTTRRITAITMVTSQVFKRIEFEKDTAFFQENKTIVRNSVNVNQTISFVEAGLSYTVSNALQDLNCNCCLFVIIKDNAGNLRAGGISYNADNDTWQFEDFRTGEGSANTGADPTADSAEFVETITGNASWYAPWLEMEESEIAV